MRPRAIEIAIDKLRRGLVTSSRMDRGTQRAEAWAGAGWAMVREKLRSGVRQAKIGD